MRAGNTNKAKMKQIKKRKIGFASVCFIFFFSPGFAFAWTVMACANAVSIYIHTQTPWFLFFFFLIVLNFMSHFSLWNDVCAHRHHCMVSMFVLDSSFFIEPIFKLCSSHVRPSHQGANTTTFFFIGNKFFVPDIFHDMYVVKMMHYMQHY